MSRDGHGFEQKIAKGTKEKRINHRGAKSTEGQKEMKMITIKFCEVPVGGRFEFRGKRYEKMDAQFGRDEDRDGNLFHPRTEVIPMQSGECGMRNGGTGSGKGHLSPALSPRGGEGVRVVEQKRAADWWLPPLRPVNWKPKGYARATRLGREPDRELRAYGTL